ncbi:glycosyltransferase family 2 protein [Kaistella flava (ex Peng et al. 2021)]|uniref:Glycosyltransferase family 2 protein n=1 Tax=Kaistella flava (ex Peng et al. 2021) TaxID=2038776 RepID=A0A7M2YAG8_9FLAO|nr:glycosyltransferase family 2 protein [Kaistella flava (ex Peng et al. 2021)]QOW10564.1 glycosyltransferase family 2 protein [Kaistella flava (ex Peng et al. 2021)]
MKLSIIIVTFNSMRLIKDCIDSIYKYNDLPDDQLEIIVVDNSSEEEGAVIKKFLEDNYDDKIIFFKNQNLGYGHGNNIGIRAATGDIIAIMNPDVRLKESLFKKAIEHFSDEQVATVGFSQHNGSTDYSYFINPEYFVPVFSSLILKLVNKVKYFNPVKFYLSGAFVFFRKIDFEKIGLYDESIFMYFEEPDVALRLNKLGKKTIFDPSRSYIHLIEVKDAYNVKLLDIGTEAIKIYFTKYKFNLKKYLKRRLLELKFHRILFTLTGNKDRVEMANAYITSLSKLL